MSGLLEGRVAIVTNAGRELGRAHALYIASQDARVLVKDLGTHGIGPSGRRWHVTSHNL